MTTEPVEYRVVRDLQAACARIRANAGYFYDVATTLVKLDPNQALEALLPQLNLRPFVLIELKPDARTYMPAMRMKIVLPVTIYWVHDSDPTVDESRMQMYFRGCADIEQAIAADISRGGLALDTRIITRTNQDVPERAEVWAVLDTEITVIRTYGQPN